MFFAPFGTRQPLRSWSFFRFFCSFEFSRERHFHGTGKCPHTLSSDKLVRVVVPSQLRVNLHASRLPRRFENASESWRRCSTPLHGQHAGPHLYMPTHQQQAHQQSNTPQRQNHAPAAAWRMASTALCVAPVSRLARFFKSGVVIYDVRVQLMISNFLQEIWQQYEHTCHV